MTGHRPKWDARRHALVEAAYQVIATRGFEGLRTRAVAAGARVNVATLHYYFSGKEALVQGVSEYLTEQFRTVHAPAGKPARRSAPQRLRQELADASYYHAKRRDLVVVMLELMLRAQRDPTIQRILRHMLLGWRTSLRQIVTAGVREGTLREDLHPDAAATVIAATITGLALITQNGSDHARARSEIGRWLAPASRARDGGGDGGEKPKRPSGRKSGEAARTGRGVRSGNGLGMRLERCLRSNEPSGPGEGQGGSAR